MTRKTISTSQASVACDVCGRTLLRGENSDVFLHGGTRRTVCELCTGRAVHEGWIREGIDDALGRSPREGAARGLLTRLRTRRDGGPAPAARRGGRSGDHAAEPPEDEWDELPPLEPLENTRTVIPEPIVRDPEPPAPEPQPAADPYAEAFHEPRGVHAVPTNAELKIARALEVFNASQHPRTVSGVARSLGAPIVSARPSQTEGSIVSVVVGWELSWYRYEIDLGDEAAGVRVIGQGAELDELTPEERTPNAAADDAGELHRVAGVA
ncbi:hypothetical protein [Paraconexibacter algicola]|uniref:hypothetical protein n=1 Tax=Paraconexibacter algicola TaxID=2133960 RepID=UPI0011B27555|nr:hypothetical protein [Paraconexibacter algicola]